MTSRPAALSSAALVVTAMVGDGLMRDMRGARKDMMAAASGSCVREIATVNRRPARRNADPGDARQGCGADMLAETIGREGGEIDRRRLAGDEFADEAGGRRRRGETDMLMAEGEIEVALARRAADRRQVVWQGRPRPHPA